MKKLTNNDIVFLRQMWQAQRLYRSSLVSWEQRAGDRLIDARILYGYWKQADLSGLGYNHGGGNGWHLIYEFDLARALRDGSPAIIAQIRERAPELLEPRPIGEAAQALFRVVR